VVSRLAGLVGLKYRCYRLMSIRVYESNIFSLLYSCFLTGGLAMHPGRSAVGFDNGGRSEGLGNG
jgi:hypothetical protein